MNRRSFTKQATFSALSMPFLLNRLSFTKGDQARRLCMSTVNFRERFASTWSDSSKLKFGPELKLTDIPMYFRDRFELPNIELWSKHFESLEPDYLSRLKTSIKKNKVKLVNIQFDEAYQIGAESEIERQKALDLSIKWMDAAKFLGSGAFRVNPGNGKEDLAMASLKALNKEAQKRGLILMVENHFGMEMNADVHVRLVQSLGKNAYTLPDFGNYDEKVRYENLQKIMPLAYQVSAKTMVFDQNMNHTSFDFDKCMQICKQHDFKGIYSVEQWNPGPVSANEEAMADWMLQKVKQYL